MSNRKCGVGAVSNGKSQRGTSQRGKSACGGAWLKAACCAVTGATILVSATGWARAATLTPEYDAFGFVGVQYANQIATRSTGIPLVADVANASMSATGAPYTSVAGSVNSDEFGNANANGRITYRFAVVGNDIPTLVTVDIATKMSVLAGSGAPGSSGQADGYIYGDSLQLGQVCAGSCSNGVTAKLDGTLQFQFDALNEPHSIELSMILSATGNGGFASGSLDPFISIDPITPNAANLSLEFSANVANGLPVAATPLPGTLPLFAGGLGFLGYLSRRRKTAPVAAAA
jgi:hypothetical protein